MMRPTTATSVCLFVLSLPQIKAEVIVTTMKANGEETANKYCQETPAQAAVLCAPTSTPTATPTSTPTSALPAADFTGSSIDDSWTQNLNQKPYTVSMALAIDPVGLGRRRIFNAENGITSGNNRVLFGIGEQNVCGFGDSGCWSSPTNIDTGLIECSKGYMFPGYEDDCGHGGGSPTRPCPFMVLEAWTAEDFGDIACKKIQYPDTHRCNTDNTKICVPITFRFGPSLPLLLRVGDQQEITAINDVPSILQSAFGGPIDLHRNEPADTSTEILDIRIYDGELSDDVITAIHSSLVSAHMVAAD